LKKIQNYKKHTITILVEKLKIFNIDISINEDDIDLIDSIYLTSKYPFGSVLPDFEPDETICKQCIEIANSVKKDVEYFLQIGKNK